MPQNLRTTTLLLTLALALAAQAQPPQKPRLIITNSYLVTMAPAQRTPFTGCLIVNATGRIQSILPGDPPACHVPAISTYDAHGQWLLPGFVSAHSHLWQSAFRGLAADQTLLGWIDALYGHAVTRASAEDLYWFTLDGALDHLRHGITSAYAFNYGGHSAGGASPSDRESFSEAAFRAEQVSGIRFVHGWEPPAASPTYTSAHAIADLQTFLTFTATPSPTPLGDPPHLLAVSINGGTAFDETPDQAVLEAALMQHFPAILNQSHYLEQPETQAYDRDTIWPWFTRAHLLSPRLFFGHFIHTSPAILAETARAGAGMSWNPLSNGRLASGTADIPAYLKAGIRVGMGVDGEASADLADPFENMRTGLYAIRAKYESAAIMSPYDVLRLHTLGSADVLGAADRIGSLEPGKFADLLLIDPHSYGVVFDPYASLVFVTSQADLARVYVGGTLLVDHTRLLQTDPEPVDQQVVRRVAAITAH